MNGLFIPPSHIDRTNLVPGSEVAASPLKKSRARVEKPSAIDRKSRITQNIVRVDRSKREGQDGPVEHNAYAILGGNLGFEDEEAINDVPQYSFGGDTYSTDRGNERSIIHFINEYHVSFTSDSTLISSTFLISGP
jgi:hypothetical protein